MRERRGSKRKPLESSVEAQFRIPDIYSSARSIHMRALKTLVAFALASLPLTAATTRESLASLSFPDATINSAQSIAAGAFTLPANPNGRGGGRGPGANPYKDLP